MVIVIGTANFNMPYGRKEWKADPESILDKARSLGINYLDGSFNYGYYGDPQIYSGFKWIVKVANEKQLMYALENNDENTYAIMAHGYKVWGKLGHMMVSLVPTDIKVGVSLYNPKEFEGLWPNVQIIEFPMNIVDVSWMPYLPLLHAKRIETVARSLFLHGTLFDIEWKGYPLAHFSFNMVRNSLVDKIILGVDTPEQLETIANYPTLEVDYEHLSNRGSKKWLSKATEKVLSLFGEEDSFRYDNRTDTEERKSKFGNNSDNTGKGRQGDNTDSSEQRLWSDGGEQGECCTEGASGSQAL